MSLNWSNITTVQQLLNVPNVNTGGWFYVVVCLLVWIVLIGVFMNWGIRTALLTSSYIALALSLIFHLANLVAFGWVLFFLSWIIFMIIYIVWSRKG